MKFSQKVIRQFLTLRIKIPECRASSLTNRIFPIVILLSLLLLNGCGEQSNPGAGSVPLDGEFSTDFPKQLQKHQSGLMAEVQIVRNDGKVNRTEALFINTDTQQMSGRIDGLPTGIYTFTIRYRLNGIVIATETTAGLVSENATSSVVFASLQFPDDDGDGFTNLAEIQFGSDYLLASSKPPAEIFRFSSSYAMRDIPGISPLGGSAVVGTSSSTNYMMHSGL